MADAELVRRAKSLLDQLSKAPRFAGSPEEATARARCREELGRSGFSCRELPFDYSQWPGRWGPPISAAIQTATILVIARTAIHQGPMTALAVGGAVLVALRFASSVAKREWIA